MWSEIPASQSPVEIELCLPFNTESQNAEARKNLKFFKNAATGEIRAYTSRYSNGRLYQVKITFEKNSVSYFRSSKPHLLKYSKLPLKNLSSVPLQTPSFKKKSSKPARRSRRLQEKSSGKIYNQFYWDMYEVLEICEQKIKN